MRIEHIKTIVTDKSDYQLRFKRMSCYMLLFAIITVVIGFIMMKWYFFVIAFMQGCATLFAERDSKEVTNKYNV